MKRIHRIFLLLLVLTSTEVYAQATSCRRIVQVTNPTDKVRTAYPVVIDLTSKQYIKYDIVSANVVCNGIEIASQIDDLNGDGKGDELAFLTDLSANETKTFNITFSANKSKVQYPLGTYAYIKLNDSKEKHPKIKTITYPGDANLLDMYNSIYGHGAVFENDYMAYRIYMDNRQSIDLYGKTTPRLEMDVTGFYTTDEQLKQGYGCDILWAGKSVGAGSFRGIRNNEPCYIDTVEWRKQTVIASGPVRSIIEVADDGWIYNGRELDMTQQYTLYAGRRDVMVEIHISGGCENELYCTGIQKLENNNTGFIQPDGLAGSWGNNVPEKGKPHHNEWVGLGLYTDDANRIEPREDEFNYLTILRTDKDGTIRYRIATCAGRKTNGFNKASDWFEFLQLWKEEIDHPCIVKIKKR